MWTLTGFADEIGADFAEQLEVVARLGLKYIDLRSAWGTNVLRLTSEQLAEAKRLLADAGIAVSCIGSPIGKIKITDDFDRHLVHMRHAAEVAEFFETPYIRLFSFFIDPDDDADRHRDEVLRRMAALASVAEQHGLVALHENEKDIYGDIPRRCVDIVESVGSAHLRLIIDPANFVQCNTLPFTDAYISIRPHLEFMHMKDALSSSHEVVPAGAGDGEVRDLVRALHRDGFDGFFSLEPHLGHFDAFGGMCGPDLWTVAHDAFTRLLSEEAIPYR